MTVTIVGSDEVGGVVAVYKKDCVDVNLAALFGDGDMVVPLFIFRLRGFSV